MTSNNVESVNSRWRQLRELPVMEMLLGIEETVMKDRRKSLERVATASGLLTAEANEYICNAKIASDSLTIEHVTEN